jgi:phosphate ABC transporter phosphate-binding protein
MMVKHFRRIGGGRLTRLLSALTVVALSLPLVGPGVERASASTYVPITGQGSTWSANAIDQWVVDEKAAGIVANYTPNGSSAGRTAFLNHTVDFAASDIPFQSRPTDGSAPENPVPGTYEYIPVTAGGTALVYNLLINGRRVTNLRLSGENIAKIFTGVITNWSDPALKQDNPQLTLPNRRIVPVVRSDGSGSTFQFSLWLQTQYPQVWASYCGKVTLPQCGPTSFYPTIPGMVAQSGDLGVAGYVSAGYAQGAIGYVNYSYAFTVGLPVAKMLNAAGYYTEPTPDNVAVSLLAAKINTANPNDTATYLTEDLRQVYVDPDKRTYPMSFYSYFILPIKQTAAFDANHGYTLATFADYAMCQGQTESATLHYSPIPYNLVNDALARIRAIPGARVANITAQSCRNPTFSTTSPNLLAQQAPYPPSCDHVGPTQCATGTGGDTGSTFINSGGGAGGGNPNAVGGSGAGSGSGGSGGSGTAGSAAATNAVGGATGSVANSPTSRRGRVANGVARGVTAGTAGAGTSSTACNADTGACGSGSASDSASGQSAQAVSTLLAARSGWGGTQTLMLLAGLLLLVLLLAPALFARYLRKRPR